MAASTKCLRCGSESLIPGHLENPNAFCVDHVTQHGRRHVGLKASLCEKCGHVEFWVTDPSLLAANHTIPQSVVQEEDF